MEGGTDGALRDHIYHMTEIKKMEHCRQNTILYQDSTMNSTQNRRKILERVTSSNLLMCSRVSLARLCN